jgi:hypothetical protein
VKRKKQRNEEWYDDKCKTMINRYRRIKKNVMKRGKKHKA